MGKITPQESVAHAERFLHAALDDRLCQEPAAFERQTGQTVVLYFQYLDALIETAKKALKPKRPRRAPR